LVVSYKGDIRSSGMLRGILVVSYKGDILCSGILRGILVVSYKGDIRSSGMLRDILVVSCYVSGKRVGPVFKGQAVQEECLDHLGT